MYEMDRCVYHCSTGADGLLKLNTAVEMLMDCCQFQEYSEKAFYDWLRANNTAVFLASIQVDILRYPAFREKLKAKVVIYDCKNIYGFRRITLRDEAGNLCMTSNAIGAFFNFRENKAIKLPPEVQNMLTKDPAEEMECLPRKIMIPAGEGYGTEPFRVTASRLDLNGHLTSSEYFAIASDALPKDYHFDRVRAEFKHQTKPGTLLQIRLFPGENGIMTAVLSDDEEGFVHAILEFSKR